MRELKIQPHPHLIAADAWVAPNATVVGQVHLGAQASVWFGAVLRGDVEPITVGEGSNIQDLCCLHSDPGYPCTIGQRVTVGHGAIVHGAVIADEVLIGMGAILLNGAQIGQHSIIGAGALIAEGKVIPPRSLVVGTPGRIIRQLTDEEVEKIRRGAQHYIDAASQYAASQYAASQNRAGSMAPNEPPASS
jgi:carbonic anhydrase/acetyltransferase-like protein (isoleucine patch superfamily)